MADRRTTQDFVTEITTRLQASDTQGLACLAFELLVMAGREIERREKDRQRKRENPRIPRNSTENVESLNGSPHPSLNPTTQPVTTAREAESLEELTHRRCAMLCEAVGPELWPDVDAFLKRRDYWTWKGWADEMLKLVTGTQYLPGDLAQVCRDDAALSRPIGSPFALRRFIGNAHRERTTPPVERGKSPRRGGVGQRTYENAMDALKDIPEAS